jgi:FkbM family methyltransferase
VTLHDMEEPWAGRLTWAYPGTDRLYRPATMRGVKEAFASILPHVQQRRVVLQAGGCIGIWPARFAELFRRVITFESHPDNLACMRHNLDGIHNLEIVHGALGDGSPVVQHDSAKGNAGGHYVLPAAEGTRSLRIDDLGLDVCDLIQLDIEGSEYWALCGAAKTIQRCRPVVVIEEKVWRGRRGSVSHDAARLLMVNKHGYRAAVRTGHDWILVPT